MAAMTKSKTHVFLKTEQNKNKKIGLLILWTLVQFQLFCGGVHLAIENCARILRLNGAFNNYVDKKISEGGVRVDIM